MFKIYVYVYVTHKPLSVEQDVQSLQHLYTYISNIFNVVCLPLPLGLDIKQIKNKCIFASTHV